MRCAATTAMLVAIVVVPTPPLGLYTATRRRGRASVRPSADTTGARSFDRWNRSSSASTRASTSRSSNGRATTSSAPASRNPIRSSTSSDAATHRIGTAAIDGVARISRHTSNPVLPVLGSTVPTSTTASWFSATLVNASSGSVVRVTV